MNPKTKGIFEAAFAKWGFESQVLVLSEEASELSAACSRFLNHKTDSSKVAEEAADVEIMIEQLRHNGMGPMIDHEKNRKMARLAQVVGVESQPSAPLVRPFWVCWRRPASNWGWLRPSIAISTPAIAMLQPAPAWPSVC